MMIAERVRAYLDYLDPGNRRDLEALRREAEEGEVPVIRRDSERFLRALLAGLRPSCRRLRISRRWRTMRRA